MITATRKPVKSEAQIFADTCRGYWMAVGALAEVESEYGGGFRRECHEDMQRMEKRLKIRIEDWNSDVTASLEAVVECHDATNVGHLGKCLIYFLAGNSGDDDGRCKPCAERKRTEDRDDAR